MEIDLCRDLVNSLGFEVLNLYFINNVGYHTDLYRITVLSSLSLSSLGLADTAALSSLLSEANFLRLLVLLLFPPQGLSLLIYLVPPSTSSSILSPRSS